MHVDRLTMAGLLAFLNRLKAPIVTDAYTELVGEVLTGDVRAAFDAAGPFVIGGVQHLREGAGVAWFSATQDKMAGHPVAVVKAIRRVITAAGYPETFAFVRAENAIGHRLARLTGFVMTGRSILGITEYRWSAAHERDGGCDHGQGGAQASVSG